MSGASAAGGADFTLLELFLADARSNAAVLVAALHNVARGTAEPAAVLTELQVASSSIKGAARIAQFEPAAILGEKLEATFRCVEQGELSLGAGRARALLSVAELLERLAASPAAEFSSWAEEHRRDLELAAQKIESCGRAEGTPLPTVDSLQPRQRASVAPALSLAPAVDTAMLALFCTEANACAATLGRGLVELEAGRTTELEGLMRAAHSIKGAARILGIGVAAQLAHAMEECFVAAQERRLILGSGHVDVLLEAVDIIVELARCTAPGLASWQKARGPAVDELSARLHVAAAGGALPEATAPPDTSLVPAQSSAIVPSRPPPTTTELLALGRQPVPAVAHDAREAANGQDRVVRVAAQSINRLMGLAGESLVESRRLQLLTSGMRRLKKRQTELSDVLEALDRQKGPLADAETAALIAEAKARTLECRGLLVEQVTVLDSYTRRVDDLSERLYREALKSRMRPFGDCVHGLPRMVRDVGRQLKKEVRLQVSGESTDVDRDVLESLEGPLNHLLRNSVDHGIESREERLANGKPAQGTIRVAARHHAGMLSITVTDDGRGIDPERVRAKIVEKSLLNAAVAATLSTAEVLEFIFLPGFSTAQRVTEISGRGVGLDAVRTAIEAASGMVRVSSELGRGTSFHLQLPVTRSVMRAVVVQVSGEPYAFPLLKIERVLKLPTAALRSVSGAPYFVLADANVSLVSAQQILGLGVPQIAGEELSVVVVADGARRYGVTIDEFLGEHDLVVRPLDARLGKTQDIAAAAILMDGSPALIFDVDDLVRSIEKLAQAGRFDKLSNASAVATERQRKRILVVDDSITVREAERQLLANRGYAVDVAVDGVDGWNSVRKVHYDLVVSDIDMPRMNGIELVRTIKQDPRLGSTPIVIVSYKDREEDRMKGLDAGANYYLTKSSFHDETLVHAVEELIGPAAT
jgi:two-component system sensor histidine kinase and response regulator WspE